MDVVRFKNPYSRFKNRYIPLSGKYHLGLLETQRRQLQKGTLWQDTSPAQAKAIYGVPMSRYLHDRKGQPPHVSQTSMTETLTSVLSLPL